MKKLFLPLAFFYSLSSQAMDLRLIDAAEDLRRVQISSLEAYHFLFGDVKRGTVGAYRTLSECKKEAQKENQQNFLIEEDFLTYLSNEKILKNESLGHLQFRKKTIEARNQKLFLLR